MFLPVARCLTVLLLFAAGAFAAPSFAGGDAVRLTRGESLLFNGKNHAGGAKGQEFVVLKVDAMKAQTFVGYTKEDGSMIAVTVPTEALEPAPADGWRDLLRGVEAFRDQQFDPARRWLAAASQDATHKALAAAVAARVNAAVAARISGNRAVLVAAVQALRETADGLVKLGHLSVAVPLDEGADKLAAAAGGEGFAASKISRDELARKVAIANRTVARARQAIALHRMTEAGKLIDEGLAAEPARPELKAWQAKVAKEVAEADDRFTQADKMRKFQKGEVHALTAIEHGLKVCSDHPRLIALKKEMSGAFEARTSPPVTPEFIAAAKVSTSAAVLAEGHKLYTVRCTECHDLELLDSRGSDGWQRAVSGMARRANLTAQEQQRILDYIAAARLVVDQLGGQ